MRALAACAALAVALTLSGCGDPGETQSITRKKILVIGVKPDQPGLGLERGDGSFEGFDVDVAKYVAGKLGAKAVFRATVSAKREQFLQQGTVDMVVATYSITAERKNKVTFGGPYYVAHQDTLVRAGDEHIEDVRDLKGKRLCQVPGSVSWQRVTEERKVAAKLVPAAAYGECLTKLIGGDVDAISTDDLILAGFGATARGEVKIINAPISDEKYGVGMRLGDVDGCEAVNKAITEMYQDGTTAALLERWFKNTSLKPTTTVPQFEGCG
ncbi:glutamate ABC transporter substrate-binding protein [Actinomadura sp. HBU206391]|uniref:glutamate ABC transporter substrate-binding protein n=1 Tax=Actinomadura sp. HBU206391 TaxID=2731692 RepID=UPI00164F2A3B|nr:glutamate ABC transporter substrate-binding protein [Actinomadura sp. HBU206391]MBC6460813.1 glutamate ABC transporter substrate-binding protein [Actinomadura sp. HBU206391]